jgi:hypothetical protein
MYSSDLDAAILEMVVVMELGRDGKVISAPYVSRQAEYSSHGRRTR